MRRSRSGSGYAWAIFVVAIPALTLAACASGGGGTRASPAGTTSDAEENRATETAPLTYESSAFNVPLSLVPDAWAVDIESATMIDIGHESGVDGGIMSLADVAIVRPDGGRKPWPNDLYAWLARQPGFETSKPVPVTVAGLDGVQIDVAVDWDPEGAVGNQPIIEYAPGQYWNLVDDPERWRFVQVETGVGRGIAVLILAGPDDFDEAAADLEGLLGTLRFA